MGGRAEGLTRRQMLGAGLAGGALTGQSGELIVPVQLIYDGSCKWKPERLDWFRSRLWPEAVGDLLKCGIRLQVTTAAGEVERPAWREPVVKGLRRGVINFVITERIPILWDRGRGVSGVSSLYRGHHMCMIALRRANAHQAPFLSVNSCLHELLHVLLGDIVVPPPGGVHRQMRELRVDSVATSLWLFGAGGAVRASTPACLARLRRESEAETASR